jgi:hypothetical protein
MTVGSEFGEEAMRAAPLCRHCERSEAIQLDRRVASLLAMTG